LKNQLRKSAFGLVEIMVAIAFFIFALIPLITLFSGNVESLRVIQARSESTLIAQELISTAMMNESEKLVVGTHDLTDKDKAGWPEFAAEWQLCELPPEIVRTLIITKNTEISERTLSARIHNKKISQADITIHRTALAFKLKRN
jgi:type II secretory pathway pseudopilin PulG